jgi:hypothetical protein
METIYEGGTCSELGGEPVPKKKKYPMPIHLADMNAAPCCSDEAATLLFITQSYWVPACSCRHPLNDTWHAQHPPRVVLDRTSCGWGPGSTQGPWGHVQSRGPTFSRTHTPTHIFTADRLATHCTCALAGADGLLGGGQRASAMP